MKHSIIIPNYNGLILLKKNLPQILEIFTGSEIIIADDASTDGSADYIKKSFPDIKLIQNPRNLGFSATVNSGVKEAGDYFTLLNTDVVPVKDFLTIALSYFEDGRTFAVGFLEESQENETIVKRGAGGGKFEKGFLHHFAASVDGSYTLWVGGGAGIFSKAIWMKLGGLENLYNPFYWEDIDLSYRAIKSGYKIYFDKNCRVRHFHEEGSISENYKKDEVKIISYRNQLFFVWLNITDKKFLRQHLLYLPYHIITAIIRRDFLFLKGFFQALKNLKTVLKKRRERRKIWKISDSEII